MRSVWAIVLLTACAARADEAAVRAALARGDHAKAIALTRAALAKTPDWNEGWWTLASLEYQTGDFPACAASASRLTRLDERAGAAWALLGLCDFEQRRFAEAAASLERGRALGIPEPLQLTAPARYAHALALLKTAQPERSLWLLYEIAGEDGATPEVVRALGLAALRMPLLPDEAPAGTLPLIERTGAAELAGWQRQNEQAERLFSELIRDYPEQRWLRFGFASHLAGRSEWQRAAEQFRAELRLAPDCFEAHLGLAWIGTLSGDPASALASARRAASLRPQSAPARLYLGRLLVLTGAVDAGIAELERARDLAPASARIRFVLAQACQQAERTADAEREFAEFERLKPAHDLYLREARLPGSAFLGGR